MGKHTSYTFGGHTQVARVSFLLSPPASYLYYLSQILISFFSGNVLRVTPHDSSSSWNLLSLDADNIIAGIAVCLPSFFFLIA